MVKGYYLDQHTADVEHGHCALERLAGARGSIQHAFFIFKIFSAVKRLGVSGSELGARRRGTDIFRPSHLSRQLLDQGRQH